MLVIMAKKKMDVGGHGKMMDVGGHGKNDGCWRPWQRSTFVVVPHRQLLL
jgi:hypothetical protein